MAIDSYLGRFKLSFQNFFNHAVNEWWEWFYGIMKFKKSFSKFDWEVLKFSIFLGGIRKFLKKSGVSMKKYVKFWDL